MHIPVLTEKVLAVLNPQANENFIDCTAGGGGHTIAILERTAPKGKVLAIDWDPEQIKNLKLKIKNYKGRLMLRQGNFANIGEIARQEKFHPVHGILFDLGLSSDQLESSARGFSFQRDEPLDMRYSVAAQLNAEKIVNYWSRIDLEQMLKEYGEERFAKEIAKEIVSTRSSKPIRKTFQLVEVIERATPKSYHRKRLHAATKTFQALRIAVNNELENIAQALRQAEQIVQEQGRIAVISFQSLEDRIVKNFFKGQKSLQQLTKKPLTPSVEEVKKNPRCRSARLRAAKKKSPESTL